MSYLTFLKGLNIASLPHNVKSIQSDYLTIKTQERNNQNTKIKEGRVAVLSLKSPIVKYNQFWGAVGTTSMIRALQSISSEKDIAGVVLDIDSGGGQAYGTPVFHDFIKNYPKPVVAYTDGLMCSAAYHIASASSYIIANKRADSIGSIGAYMHLIDLEGIKEKEGAKVHKFYATKSEEKNAAFEEVLKGNYDRYTKEVLDPLVDEFIDDIKNSRPSIDEKVFKGASYNAEESLKNGLIDHIGLFEDAINKVFELSSLKDKVEEQKENQNTNENNLIMEEIQNNLPVLSTLLGKEGGLKLSSKFFSDKRGLFLTDEQLGVIENELDELKTKANFKNESLKSAQRKLDKVKQMIDESLAKVGLQSADSNEGSIRLLGDLLLKYGLQAGDTPTEAISEGDRFENKDSLINESDSHNTIYKNA